MWISLTYRIKKRYPECCSEAIMSSWLSVTTSTLLFLASLNFLYVIFLINLSTSSDHYPSDLCNLHPTYSFLRYRNLRLTLGDVHRPMLGADFFCSNHLLIDVYTRHIVDAETYESVPLKHHVRVTTIGVLN